MINKQYLIFNTQQSFEEALAAERIKRDAIVFIKETNKIWTHGSMFGGEEEHNKGFFNSVDKLPAGKKGDWAIVWDDGDWWIYTYNAGYKMWEKGAKYEVPDFVGDLYVKKEDLRTYLKNLYDGVYVRRDELYLDETSDGGGSDYGDGDDPGGSTPAVSPGNIFTEVDLKLDKESYNPVANWVICRALGDFYSKAEVDKLVQAVPTMKILVVDALPVSDINPNAVYIVKSAGTDDLFTEYIYSEDQWISLGTQSINIDLSGYVTSDALSNYVTKGNIPNYLVGYVKQDDLSSYAKKDLLELFATKAELADYATWDQVVKKSDLYTGDGSQTTGSDTPGSSGPTGSGGTSQPGIPADVYTKALVDELLLTLRQTLQNTSGDDIKHIFINQNDYDALSEYQDNAIYFVLEGSSSAWKFGDTFPIHFGKSSGFGSEFPITLI